MSDADPQEDLEDLYENAPCGYLSLRSDGRIFKANATVASWLGVSGEHLVGRRLSEFLNVAGRIFLETHFVPLLRMQGFFNEVALDLVTPAGGQLPVLVNARERRDPNGAHLFTRLTIFNATNRRRYERQLVDARSAAEAAERELRGLRSEDHAILLDERATAALREEFIAVLGHDLRNPLAAMIGGISLLLKTPLDDRARSVIGMMQNSADRMAELIENVLDFARGRLNGGLEVARDRDAAVEPMLRQVIAELQTVWPTRVFQTEIAVDEPVECDLGRISQLVSNLLGNALIHGAPDAPIRIKAETDQTTFRVAICNAGSPIPDETLGRMFEPFFRADSSLNRQGLGLGLHICSEIAKAHGGALTATSDEDETCFTFSMPRRVSC